MSLSSTCCPQREFTLRHSLALTPRETSNASSVLRKARWQLTFLFLEVEFLLLRFWRETSNREKNPKGNLSYQIWVTLSCPKACWAPFDREAHRAGFLRWCVLGFLVHVLPGGILGCISCEQTPGGIAGPWSMKGCFKFMVWQWRSVMKQKHKFNEIQRSQEPGSIALFSWWA